MMNTELLPRPISLDELSPYEGAIFRVDCSPDTVDLTLIEVQPLKNGPEFVRPPFNLTFHSAPEIFLVEGMYAMRSGRFGPALIYISPMTRPYANAPVGQYYQAVFN